MSRWVRIALFAGCLLAVANATAQGQTAVSRTVADILQQLDQYKPDAEAYAKRLAAFNTPVPETTDSAVLARHYHSRARDAQALGLIDERIDMLEKALPHARRANLRSSAAGGNLDRVLSDLSNAWGARDYLKAIAYAEELLKTTNNAGGYYIGETAKIANYLTSLGEYEASDKMIARAESALVSARMGRDYAVYGAGMRSYVEYAKAYNLRDRGKLAESEQLFRSVIALTDEAQRSAADARARGADVRSEADIAGYRESATQVLALTLQRMGRLDEAELMLRDLLKVRLSRTGRGSIGVADNLRSLAGVLSDQGRTLEALQLAAQSVRMLDELGVPKKGLSSLWAHQLHAGLLTGVGRYADSAREYEAIRESVGADSQLRARFGAGNRVWAYALMKTGRAAQAVDMLRGTVERTEKVLGQAHVDTAFARAFLGMAHAAAGDRAAAYRELRSGIETLTGADGGQVEYIRRSLAATRRLALVVGAYIKLLSEMRGTPLEAQNRIDAAAEAFRVSDLVRGQVVLQAVAASAARAAADSPQLAALIRKDQDLTQEVEALYRFLIEQLSAPPERQLPKVIADMRSRIAAIDAERRTVSKEIQTRFPAYADFVNPKSPTLAQVRAGLREGEVLLSVLTTADASFVWAIPKTGATAFHSSALTTAELGRRVATLRKALDVGTVPLESFPVFDVAMAHGIFRELLAPVQSAWKDAKSLLVTVSGPLSQLPFSVLPTEPVALKEGELLFEAYKDVPWLAKRYAVAQLPSVNSLLTLRAMRAGREDRKTFAGFGDPVFGGGLAQAGSTRSAGPVLVRNLAVTRVTDAAVTQVQTVNWTPYSSLAPLPDTRDELLAIAKALDANLQSDVFLGSEASKEKVIGTDLSGRKILAFATHGLLPGDFPGIDQPALALSAPGGNADANPRSALLTMDDILGLKLDADWVVLSACNSGAGDGKGSDAISGLGRAFFYAGSRALLVTHWPVDSRSARLLVSGVFERYAADGSLSRTEALRRAMIAVMNDSFNDERGRKIYSYAHPMFWAPYALVGDSGR